MGIQIFSSVGRGGVNAPSDVIAIGGALVGVGIDNGGVFGAPLSLDALGDAIANFQSVQGISSNPDGRVDPGGGTLRRFNAILFPDEVGITALDPAGSATSVSATTWAPDPVSLSSEFIFQWITATGSGQIRYFQLAEAVVPRWFGVLVPDSGADYDTVQIFFHPTPAQAGYNDAEYPALGSFRNIFHYLSDNMGSQFCASGTRRILVMPLMTQASASDCGVFPQRWAEILGCILGRLSIGVDEGAPFQRVSSVVVSSFSSGITYSHNFRARANLGSRLAGVIDFDGVISSYSQLSQALTGPAGQVVKFQQSQATPASIAGLAGQNIFAVPRPRWGGPWADAFDPNPQTALLQVHGTIPQTMMQLAAGAL